MQEQFLKEIYKVNDRLVVDNNLNLKSYKNVCRWADMIKARPAVKRGRIVNKTSGRLELQLRERHDASDFNERTQDKLELK